ncbi:hypothetical protein E4T56_gene1150 [Termitomyces sp. T112]|nr:hypothetical protein E4T56_gene1150 [Termitomyces sp. T112]
MVISTHRVLPCFVLMFGGHCSKWQNRLLWAQNSNQFCFVFLFVATQKIAIYYEYTHLQSLPHRSDCIYFNRGIEKQ